jgi:hypothetical protein
MAETVESKNMDVLFFEDFERVLEDFEHFSIELRESRAEMMRIERRIALMAALLAVDGVTAELPADLDSDVAERLKVLLGRRDLA